MTRLLPFAALLIACSAIDSSYIDTAGIHADIEIIADGEGTSVVRAELRSGSDTLDLAGEDQLFAQVDEDEREMIRREDIFDQVRYTAEFPRDALGTEFRVALLRAEKSDARDTKVSMPPRFLLTQPRGTFSIDQTIPIVWDRSAGDPLTVSINGDCIHPVHQTLSADTGRWLAQPGRIEAVSGFRGSCELQITVERERRGHLDPSFEGGQIVARQVRTRRITLEVN